MSRRTNLRKARWSDVTLDHAYFRQAKFEGFSLSHAFLVEASLDGAPQSGAPPAAFYRRHRHRRPTVTPLTIAARTQAPISPGPLSRRSRRRVRRCAVRFARRADTRTHKDKRSITRQSSPRTLSLSSLRAQPSLVRHLPCGQAPTSAAPTSAPRASRAATPPAPTLPTLSLTAPTSPSPPSTAPASVGRRLEAPPSSRRASTLPPLTGRRGWSEPTCGSTRAPPSGSAARNRAAHAAAFPRDLMRRGLLYVVFGYWRKGFSTRLRRLSRQNARTRLDNFTYSVLYRVYVPV